MLLLLLLFGDAGGYLAQVYA